MKIKKKLYNTTHLLFVLNSETKNGSSQAVFIRKLKCGKVKRVYKRSIQYNILFQLESQIIRFISGTYILIILTKFEN